MKKRKSTSVVRKSRKLKSVKHKSKKAQIKHLIRRKRPLHKRILLHPATIFLLLCTGVLIIGSTFRADAENITVTASILAPLPSSAAEITYPANQARLHTPTVKVAGNCTGNTYVMLYRNGIFSGNANCGPMITSFQIQTDLSIGINKFYTRVFNVTDNEGPQSTTIDVFYDLPAGSQKSSITVKPSVTVKPLTINHTYEYKIYRSDKPSDWNLSISGGVSPYALTVDWGDGDTSTVLRSNTNVFKISHAYALVDSTIWAENTIKISAVDSKETVANLQLSALVTVDGSRPNNDGTGTADSSVFNSVSQFVRKNIWTIAPAFGVVTLMSTSFWLGELEEYSKIARNINKFRPHFDFK